MEWKIGEIKQVNGDWYQCVEGNGCADCAFYEKPCNRNPLYETIGSCRYYRKDATSVIFKKLEKVGEPYMDGGKIMQKYKRVYREPIYFPYKELNCYNDLHGRICIEIKQNKEDMEEKDIKPYDKIFSEGTVSNTENLVTSSLKPFDLEAAKAGKPVCTRDGRKARIICFDRKLYHDGYNYPIVAMVNDNDNDNELVHAYTQDGLLVGNMEGKLDLMMLPEKKEGWVNVYYDNDASSHRGCRFIYDTKERAVKEAGSSYITTVKINWEE